MCCSSLRGVFGLERCSAGLSQLSGGSASRRGPIASSTTAGLCASNSSTTLVHVAQAREGAMAAGTQGGSGTSLRCLLALGAALACVPYALATRQHSGSHAALSDLKHSFTRVRRFEKSVASACVCNCVRVAAPAGCTR